MRLQSLIIPTVILVGSVQAVWPFKSSAPAAPSNSPIPIPSYDELLLLLEQEDDDSVVASVTTTSVISIPTPSAATILAQAVVDQEPFTGLEYRLGPYLFRPSALKREGLVLLALIAYYLSSWFGASISSKHAKAWFDSNLDLVGKEFAQVGMGTKRFEKDGGDEFVSFATGRRAIESVTIRVFTKARHDLIMALFNFISIIANTGTDKDSDKIVLKFKLFAPTGTPDAKFIFAIAQKTALTKITKRFDLTTFTKPLESLNGVPKDLIVMCETEDIANVIVKDDRRAFGLIEGLVEGVEGREFFESLVISDMPASKGSMNEDKPRLPTDEYTLTLTLRLPPINQVALTKPFITLACNIADVLHSKPALLGPVTVFKLKKTRAEQQTKLMEPEEERLREARIAKKEEDVSAKAKVAKEKEDLRIKNMTKGEKAAHFAKIKADKAEKDAERKEIEKKEAELKKKQRR